MFNYGIGGTDAKADSSEAFADIPQNRTLIIENLTAREALKPEMVQGLQTVEDIFAHFKPEKEVEFVTDDGLTHTETLRFASLDDYSTSGITAQSTFLRDLNNEKDQYDKFFKQIRTNKMLVTVLNDAQLKQEYLNVLTAMIQEIEEVNNP